MCASRGSLGYLELELLEIVSFHMGAENLTQVLCKSS